MATQQELEKAKQEARDIAKEYINGDRQLGYATIYTWVYKEYLPAGVTGPVGDFTEAQLDEILQAGEDAMGGYRGA